jgi:3-dehydroquinate synthase II
MLLAGPPRLCMLPWMCAELPELPVADMQVERRPLVLLEATAEHGEVWSTTLQSAEAVRLVGPGAAGDRRSGARRAGLAGDVSVAAGGGGQPGVCAAAGGGKAHRRRGSGADQRACD